MNRIKISPEVRKKFGMATAANSVEKMTGALGFSGWVQLGRFALFHFFRFGEDRSLCERYQHTLKSNSTQIPQAADACAACMARFRAG